MEPLGRNASPSSSAMIALTSRIGTKPDSFPSVIKQSVNVTAVLHGSIRLKDHRGCCCSPISAYGSLSRRPVQVDLEEPFSESVNRSPDETDTVRVRFLLQKKCKFGEHFVLVGNDSVLGSWDPDSGIPLNWSDGHLWSVELNIPVGKTIKYKFILKANSGKLLWQPDPDRVIETRGTTANTTIVVLEDWKDPRVRKIVEEKDPSFVEHDEHDPKPDAAGSGWKFLEAGWAFFKKSETIRHDVKEERTNGRVVTKEDSEPVADNLVPDHSIETVSMNAITAGSDVITGEKPVLFLIADNISSYQEENITSYTENARLHRLVEESVTTNQPKEEPFVLLPLSNGNGRRPLLTVTNSTSVDIDGTSIPGEVVPVLVPGLSLIASTRSEGVADVKNPTSSKAKAEEMLEDKKNAPSGSENGGVLGNYMRYMQNLLSNIGRWFCFKKKEHRTGSMIACTVYTRKKPTRPDQNPTTATSSVEALENIEI